MRSKTLGCNFSLSFSALCFALLTPLHSYSQTVDLASIDWIHGAPNCEAIVDGAGYQEWQQLRYRNNSFIFRQNKCSNYEAPFVYLFIGTERGLLIDTGATLDGGESLLSLIREITALPIVVAHTHGHGDHRMGDEALSMNEDTTVVGVGQIAVEAYFAFPDWPSMSVTFELGGRDIEILPIPGHSDDDLAFYDAASQVLITGDTLYPGRLYVRNWPAYRKSIERLADWTTGKSISTVLGTHIEMSALPNTDYPIGTTYQPDEHQLPLSVSDIFTLRDVLEEYENPERIPLGSFIVWPI